MTSAPYKGTGTAMTDLIGGRVDLLCDRRPTRARRSRGGKLEACAVGRPTTPALQKLPTLEGPASSGFNVSVWHGLHAPKETSKAMSDIINAALRVAWKDPEFVERD